ncbi:MAG: phage portal protein [Zoogloea sp.]|nr:phage portal protein [Zoogloea sp.]
MNVIDRIVSVFNPVAGLKRAAARQVLAKYEAAEPSRLRKFYRDTATANQLVKRAGPALRAQARHLQRNHDIVTGALRTFANNVVGADGLGIEPQPKHLDGTIHKKYAADLKEAWRDWCKSPEVTHRFTWSRLQRIVASTWARDGELFLQRLAGPVPFLDHNTRVPYSLEALEAEMIPQDYDSGDRIRQGCERNAWGQPVAWWAYKTSPDDVWTTSSQDLKRVPADRMLHIAHIERLHQIRGVSMLASVITRLEDIKDYEESERIAAKIAAMLTAYVKKGTPDQYESSPNGTTPAERLINLQPGTIIDSLGIGEEIGLIDSKRPNPNVITFRQGQLRAAAAGFPISYSSLSRDYNGSFSAQRQELVEQYVHYACCVDDLTGMCQAPVWAEFVAIAHLSGVVKMPADLMPGTADDALYVAAAMPWIDPLKEALAAEALVKARFAAPQEIIRKRGGNPDSVLDQTAAWEKGLADREITSTTASSTLDPQIVSASLRT